MNAASRARPATPAGLVVGLVLWFASLTPTLVPRGWIVQGVTSGVCLALGYGIGALAERAVRRTTRRQLDGLAGGGVGRVAARAAALAVAVAGTVAWATWQDEARDLVGMSHLESWEGAPMVILSAVVAVILIRIGNACASWLEKARHAGRRGRVGRRGLAAVVVATALIGVIGSQLTVRAFAATLNVIYGALDEGTGKGVERPTLATVSGSASSLVPWETMGMWGRAFAAGVTGRDELVAYHGKDAAIQDPVRVFVGVETAGSTEERAALAVRELERAGGFERRVLAVWVPAGSGWMDPDATRALELLHGGDTAIVAMQYSVLPSFFSLVLDSSQAIAAGAALFDAVHERWSALPEQHRPRLIVFGASLGASGAERPFVGPDAAQSAANFASRADGALIVGSLGWNPVLRQVTEARRPGSPAWQPTYGDGRTVRFLTGGRPEPDAAWGRSRVVYLQHPSDPVAYLSLEQIWSPPDWMDEPRGRGIPPATGWFPIVSTVQAIADLSFSASLPSGFGHDYRVDYADAFATVAPPEAWTPEDTARLEAYLATRTETAATVP
jgi:uncharacterized membrane protein